VKVLLLGGNGSLGPHVVNELQGDYELRITDIVPIESEHETMEVDVSDIDQVRKAAEGTDAIVNCSVLRPHRQLAFDINAMGTYNAVLASVEQGHSRFINTGPHFTQVGPSYEHFDFAINEEVPLHPGLNLYAHSKSVGQEICRVFSANHPLHILTTLFLSFRQAEPKPDQLGGDTNPFSVTFPDGARAIRKCLEVDLETLPSRCEIFHITTDTPHGRYSNAKARRLLGWEPQDLLEGYWRKPMQYGHSA
jgi:nucleoside-diphosphate-sugar epimerase